MPIVSNALKTAYKPLVVLRLCRYSLVQMSLFCVDLVALAATLITIYFKNHTSGAYTTGILASTRHKGGISGMHRAYIHQKVYSLGLSIYLNLTFVNLGDS